MGNLENRTQQEIFEFTILDQPWNKNKSPLELCAAFANPELVKEYHASEEKDTKKSMGFYVTEGRWEKVVPLLRKHKILGNLSGGMDPQVIGIPARSQYEAFEKIVEMFVDIQREMPEYLFNIRIGYDTRHNETTIQITPSPNL